MRVMFRRWGWEENWTVPTTGDLRRLVWHWSAGNYTQVHHAYHLCVQGPPYDGRPIFTHSLEHNMRQVGTGAPYAAHTWRMNSWCAGLSLMGMAGAVMRADGTYDFGRFPLTDLQIECLAWTGALLHKLYAIPFEQMVTHHEAYQAMLQAGVKPPDFRWDLKVLEPADGANGGDILRGKARWYVTHETWEQVLVP